MTGLDRFLVGGRWYEPGEQDVLLLPARMARELGLDTADPQGEVQLWGRPI